MREIDDEFAQTCGPPRLTGELANRGHVVNHKRVERLMRVHGMSGFTNQPRFGPRSLLITTHRCWI